MRLAPLLLLQCLTHASAECPVAHCVDNINGQGNFALELNESLRSSVVCVRGAPFLSQAISPQLFLKIFDVQRVIVQCNNLTLALRVRTVSEDTRFTDVFRTASAVNRSVSSDTVHTNRATLLWDVEEKVYQMQMAWEWLRPVIEFVFGGTSDTMELRFSPFHTSCVIVEQKAMYRGTSFNVNVTTLQDGPFVIGRGQVPQRVLLERSPVWRGPVMLILGAFLLYSSRRLVQSVTFHYASAISISMMLGIILLAMLLWYRLSRRSAFAGIASILGMFGVTSTVWERFQHQLLFVCYEYWPYALAYMVFFALIGYIYTWRRLEGFNLPKEHERNLLAQLMRMGACLFLLNCSNSVRGSFTLLVTICAAQLGPHVHLRGLFRNPFRTRAVHASATYMENGRPYSLRPPTSSGQFLSEEEYAQQTAIATNSALTQLFSSPAYASWMLNNHHRMRFDSAHSMGSAEDDEQSDCSMHAES